MGEPINVVVIQHYGIVYGKPVKRMGNLVGLSEPRLVLEARTPEGKLVGYEFGVIIGKPDILNFSNYLVNFEAKDEGLLKKYYESTTGLQLAPSGIKLV